SSFTLSRNSAKSFCIVKISTIAIPKKAIAPRVIFLKLYRIRFSVRSSLAEKYSLKKEIIRMLTIVAAIIIAKTILPPKCHPNVLLINQPHAKQSTESTNHTAKLLSPKLNRLVLRKFDENIRMPSNAGVKKYTGFLTADFSFVFTDVSFLSDAILYSLNYFFHNQCHLRFGFHCCSNYF